MTLPYRPRFRLPPISRDLRRNLVLLACLALFAVYGSFRQRYIWGVDSFGYYQLGKLFNEGRLHLPSPLPGFDQQALVPFGFTSDGTGQATPDYPPGFPLLLALGHLVGAPRWVTPFLGVVSCFVLFTLLRERVREGAAWLFTAAWAFMPLTVYGSTMMMSDLVAATAVMAGFLAFRRGYLAGAGWILGFSFAVRPTNVLFLLPLALLLRPDRRALRLGLHLALSCALYATYNYCLYGAPWRTGYGNISDNLVASIFPSHFAFYATTSVVLLSPLVIGLAACGLAPWNREKLSLLVWPLTLMVFYSFWLGGGIDRWWWARFILPGYWALFLLAADGFENLLRWAARRAGERVAPVAGGLLMLALLVLPCYYIRYGRARGDVWVRGTGQPNFEVVGRVGAFAPPGSLVGSVELCSSFTLYSELVPFLPIKNHAPALIEQALAAGRHVYLLPEPWNASNPVVAEIERRFRIREIARYNFIWEGLPVYEVSAR
ncbi:MAG: putative rane protein [Lacunisphaera sp.]|nr:putative rane protein [Lacunisphaera sp.]